METLAETQFQRHLLAPGVQRIPLAVGDFCNGTLFLPSEASGAGPGPYPLVVRILGGVQKGQVIEDQSALLAARCGVASFSMGFYGVNGLPKTYLGRPLDVDKYEKCLDHLMSLPKVKSDVGAVVIGSSKGAELALLMSSFTPDKISGVISINGLCNSLMNDVTQHRKTVLEGIWFEDMEKLMSKVKRLDGNIVNLQSLSDFYKFEGDKSTIPFHKNRKARYMFVAGGDDQNYQMQRMQEYARSLAKQWSMEDRYAHYYTKRVEKCFLFQNH